MRLLLRQQENGLKLALPHYFIGLKQILAKPMDVQNLSKTLIRTK